MDCQRVQISLVFAFVVIALLSCSKEKDTKDLRAELAALDLERGEITLCGAGTDQLGTVAFGLACSEAVRKDFNLATALLHSFEYTEAEKVFVKVVEQDPRCVMAYWGIAMSNFHPLWSAPDSVEMVKGAKVITLARSLVADTSSREAHYIEAVGTIFDIEGSADYKSRLLKFEQSCQKIYALYPDDSEAAIFYALALGASADPKDKTFKNQRKAGKILNTIFENNPNHPGIAHYLIHIYDYPEIANEGLSAARKYASIASASAHAQHMPSHIFTRLGLWDESIKSNLQSISAARCYAAQSGVQGHWDEELHGLDYLIYAYLQQGNDAAAKKQLDYLNTIDTVSPVNFKGAYSFAAGSARYAVERKDWEEASNLDVAKKDFPWEKFPWETANLNFACFLGAIQTNKFTLAKKELENLQSHHKVLLERKDNYKANLVRIQILSAQAWIKYSEKKPAEALALMAEAATMEEATAKHPVTPGEIIPARELLADLYLLMGKPRDAQREYENDLKKHPNKFNVLYGAALASVKVGDLKKARLYYKQLLDVSHNSGSDRLQLDEARKFVANFN